MINCVHVPLFRGMSSMLPVLYHLLEEEKLCKRYYSDLQAGGAPPTRSRWSRSILYEPVWWRQSHLAEIFAGAITSLNSHKRELSWERNHWRKKGGEGRRGRKKGTVARAGSRPRATSGGNSFFFFFFFFCEERMWAHPAASRHLKQRHGTFTRAAYRGKNPQPVARTSECVIPHM